MPEERRQNLAETYRESLGRYGGHWKANKNEQREWGPSMCVRSLFKKKC